MILKSYKDAELFSRDTAGLLSSSAELEMENNVLISIVERIRKGYYEDAYMAVVLDGERPILAALRTPPHQLIVSRGESRACRLVAEDLFSRGSTLPGVTGLADMSAAFALEWAALASCDVAQGPKLLFYVLTEVSMSSAVNGFFRDARQDDVKWLPDWELAFAIEAGLPDHEQKRDPEKILKRIEDGEIFVWDFEGRPVSIAAFAPITPNGARVGLVYTPPNERGKGYASACVAHLSQRILDSGKNWCCLFADPANPISNRIYQRLGYSERSAYQEYSFASSTAIESN